ncbi:unnamed protein product [Eretmochelys imbricata]
MAVQRQTVPVNAVCRKFIKWKQIRVLLFKEEKHMITITDIKGSDQKLQLYLGPLCWVLHKDMPPDLMDQSIK